MSPSARARHLYVVGATRTGKSKLLETGMRQDILNWPYTQSGVILLDWHGTLYENIVSWLAAENLSGWPIIPFELRRQDWCISYNLLRKRGIGDPAVVVNNSVRAMLHGWGQTNTNETPRLAKWLRTILMTLYCGNFTLAEAKQLITSREIRRKMAAMVEDHVAQMVWETAPRSEDAFQEHVESAVSRLMKFLSTQVVRACLCQSECSLDMGNVLDRGGILLVSLSREGATFDEEDASTFGSLILSDLWTAAQARGKREEGEITPSYVYIDEFQEFLTPTMAKTLDQASGFGLHFTLAHQFPSQLLRKTGDQAVYDSVMANARSKVVFQLEHPEDLEMLALMQFRREINTDEIKYQGFSTRVVGYDLKYVPGSSESTTQGTADSKTTSRSRVDTSTNASTYGTSSSDGFSFPTDFDPAFALMFGAAGSSDCGTINSSSTNSTNFTDSWATADAEGSSIGSAKSTAYTSAKSLNPMLEPQLAKEPLPPIYRSVQEQIFRATQFLAGLPDRHCVVRIVGDQKASPMVTTTIAKPLTMPDWTDAWTQSLLKDLEFALPLKDAMQRINSRAATMALPSPNEPESNRRKVVATKPE